MCACIYSNAAPFLQSAVVFPISAIPRTMLAGWDKLLK